MTINPVLGRNVVKARYTGRAYGKTIDDITQDAVTQCEAFFGTNPWIIVDIDAEPHATEAGSTIATLNEATFEAILKVDR